MYEVKGKSNGHNVLYVIQDSAASSLKEAVDMAEGMGMEEVFAVYLTKYRELFYDRSQSADDNTTRQWYSVTASEIVVDDKKVDPETQQPKTKENKFTFLLSAVSLDHANERADEEIVSAYGFQKRAIKAVKVDQVL